LADNIASKFPAFKYFKVLKHPDEWENYSEDICNLFGFSKNAHPLIFYSHGQFIGGKDEFYNFVGKNYGLNLKFDSKVIYNLTQENLKKVYNDYDIVK
jgi:hypothetical protein